MAMVVLDLGQASPVSTRASIGSVGYGGDVLAGAETALEVGPPALSPPVRPSRPSATAATVPAASRTITTAPMMTSLRRLLRRPSSPPGKVVPGRGGLGGRTVGCARGGAERAVGVVSIEGPGTEAVPRASAPGCSPRGE